MEVRIKRWFLQKNNMYAGSMSGRREGRYTEQSWLIVNRQTDKAYHLDQTQKYIPEGGWIPKSVVIETRGESVPSHITKKYMVSERMLFGLESMRDKCMYLLNCKKDLELEEVSRLYDLHDECEELICKARYAVDGKTYGRITEIMRDREYMRFITCIESGMPYEQASAALRGE